MKKPTNHRVTFLLLLFIFAVAAFILSHFIASGFEPFATARLVIRIAGILPFTLLGGLIMLWPRNASEAMSFFSPKYKPESDRSIRIRGLLIIVITLFLIISSYNSMLPPQS